jgi:hypothetical protein
MNFSIIKERDYFSFTVKADCEEEILQTIANSTATEKIVSQIEVLKAPKRGFKSNSNSKKEKNIDFVKKSINRFNGQPIYFHEKKLIKMKEFLTRNKTLNSVQI